MDRVNHRIPACFPYVVVYIGTSVGDQLSCWGNGDFESLNRGFWFRLKTLSLVFFVICFHFHTLAKTCLMSRSDIHTILYRRRPLTKLER